MMGRFRWAWLGMGGLMAIGLMRRRAKSGDSPTLPGGPRLPPSTDWHEVYLGGSLATENEMVNRFAEEIKSVQSEVASQTRASKPRRAFHAKIQAGITNAELRVSDRLPEHLQIGFLRPRAVYPATVRLSNADGRAQSDHERDMRGLAVRVHLDDGHVQDLLTTNAPASHARDAAQFMAVATAFAGGSVPGGLVQLARSVGLGETVRMMRALGKARRVVDSLATESYFSRSPFTFGKYAVKYRFEPESGVQPGCRGRHGRSGDDFLREDLVERLRQAPVVWDLQIQPYVDSKRTPIEDGSVLWTDADARPETIAQLVLPQQDLTSEEAEIAAASVEALEFNPWNHAADDVLKPLGSLNRARRVVYPASAGYRASREPDDLVRESPFWKSVWTVTEGAYRIVNRFVPWHRLPPLIGAINLAMYRRELRRDNLHDTSKQLPVEWPTKAENRFLVSRSSEGRYNDLAHPEMGSRGYRFGRNVPLKDAFPGSDASILEPNPRLISERLLARKEFVPATSLNLLAAAWIQFQVHDWVSHNRVEADPTPWRIPVHDDHWDPKAKEIVVRRTLPDDTRTVDEAHLPPTYINQDSHWWDGSQIYGSDEATTGRLRSQDNDGHLTVDKERNLLPFDEKAGRTVTGVSDNFWVGLTILHNLFALEHNAICDMLKRVHPSWTGERTFDVARLINVALMAKIHTVEWTPAILAHPALQIGMNANWSGLEGAALQRLFGRLTSDEVISGIPGSVRDHAGVPYALTEEFVSVYRLHPLIPDELHVRHIEGNDPPKVVPVQETTFKLSQDLLNDYSLADLTYSFALSNPGAVTLKNYPQFLRNLTLPDGDHLDLAAVDILRDRERGVPRYNRFRELLHRGRVRTFAEITPNREWAQELEEIYRDVNEVDLMVGMFAEEPPEGFGFSDTAFRIFILMASRRLKSDRFFTTDWRPEVYTREGMEWIANNGMASVLLRHFPELGPALRTAKNPFAPWAPPS